MAFRGQPEKTIENCAVQNVCHLYFFFFGGESRSGLVLKIDYIYIYTCPLKSHDGLKAYLLKLPIFLRVSMFVFRPSNLTHQVGWMFSPILFGQVGYMFYVEPDGLWSFWVPGP